MRGGGPRWRAAAAAVAFGLLQAVPAARADWLAVSDLLGVATPAEALEQEFGLAVRRALAGALGGAADPGCVKSQKLEATSFAGLAKDMLAITLQHYSTSQNAAIDVRDRDKEFATLAGAAAESELKALTKQAEISAVRLTRKLNTGADMVAGALNALVDPLAELGVTQIEPDRILEALDKMHAAAKAPPDAGGPDAKSLIRYEQISAAADEAVAASMDLEKALQAVEANQAQLPRDLAKHLNAACIKATAK